MIDVSAIEMVGLLALGLVVLRAAWLVAHPAVHHAALRPAHWATQVDRVLHTAEHRA
ncbi:hypothetical protein SAMN04489844_3217 [Nocardioides exalbidus]|uniref:Uncharacterized protein n=1 Tax=Nocardioides exalbidus TaxID=402596 RepID=A0A1H4WAK2_9ACTN|nr:hypothetical protein [Nocardioides exalbidus]SEC90120.1 hypothetical protein SAMN04489844_3217 [Nocardioides exalbidus]